MNRVEALDILVEEIRKYRSATHEQLKRLLTYPETAERLGRSGVLYQVEVHAVWDSEPDGVLRLFFSVDDQGWRAFSPLTRCGLVAPGGIFDGEVA